MTNLTHADWLSDPHMDEWSTDMYDLQSKLVILPDTFRHHAMDITAEERVKHL